VECPEGFKVVLKNPEQLKTPEETSVTFKGRFKGMSLSAYPRYFLSAIFAEFL
jgi:hypothetical protein